MTPEIIRSLWQLIELLPHDILLTHDQDAFIDLLVSQLMETQVLEASQIETVKLYLKNKTPLICALNEGGQFSQDLYLSA